MNCSAYNEVHDGSRINHKFLLHGDPRIRDWPLMGSPAAITTIIGFYLIFSMRLGPYLMRRFRHSKPFEIRKFVVLYNIAMVVLSVYFCVLTIKYAYILSRYNVFCQENDSARNPYSDIFFYHAWWYIVLKVGELLDTIFFVLMMKESHITFLHVLHHSLALATVWLDVNMGVAGQVALFPVLNSLVHMVMYTYYALAALDSSIRPNLWWKRYVTQLQIVQFVALAMHGSIPIFYDCNFPPSFAAVMTGEATLFAYLFTNFYVQTYIKKKNKQI